MPRNDATNLEQIIDEINTRFSPEGSLKPIIARGSEFADPVFIPCMSPAIGHVLGTGGWPEGQLIELFGKEHSAKSSLMFTALKDCFDFYNGEKIVAVIDMEHRFNPEWASQLGLVKDENLIVAQPPNGEVATDIMHKLIKSGKVCAIGFDSIASAAGWRSQQEFDEQATMMGGNAAIMARMVNTIGPLANLYKVSCFFANQLRQDLSPGPWQKLNTPGGNSVKHRMSVRMYLRPGIEKFMDKIPGHDEPVQVGFPIVVKTVKNSFGPPFREGWTNFYNVAPTQWLDHVGFDVEEDLQRLGLLTGVAGRRGAWYTYQDILAQGRDKFFQQLREKNLFEQYKQEVLDALKLRKTNSYDSNVVVPIADGPDINDAEV